VSVINGKVSSSTLVEDFSLFSWLKTSYFNWKHKKGEWLKKEKKVHEENVQRKLMHGCWAFWWCGVRRLGRPHLFW